MHTNQFQMQKRGEGVRKSLFVGDIINGSPLISNVAYPYLCVVVSRVARRRDESRPLLQRDQLDNRPRQVPRPHQGCKIARLVHIVHKVTTLTLLYIMQNTKKVINLSQIMI